MSLVYLTKHDENIYDYGKEEISEDMNTPPMYKSKARKITKIPKPDTERVGRNTLILTSTKKYTHKTMGYAETPLYAPCDYLKKNDGVRFQRKRDHICGRKFLPPVPKYDAGAKNEKEQEDFKMKNIKAVVCKSPRRPKPRFVFTRKGDVQVLCNSGLMPAYVFRPNYGQVPKYIIASKKAEQEAIEMKRKAKITGFTLISPEERFELLAGLKSNWQSMQRTFQLLPVLTDTAPKSKRKTDMEKELRKLEQDILLIENNPLIYVCDDDPKSLRTEDKAQSKH